MSRNYSENNESGFCLATLNDLEKEAQHLCERIGAAVGNVGTMRDAAHMIATSSTIMSAAAEELSLSIHHIAEQTEDAARATSKAAKQAALASDLVTRLESTTRRIRKVVQAISGVARNTRMLALNARNAVDNLAQQVTQLDAINSNISCAVQQQGGASSEIARSLASTVESLGDVTDGISGIINASKYNEGAAQNIVSGIGALKAVGSVT
jgi:methyl-accepting chemotaxis protein